MILFYFIAYGLIFGSPLTFLPTYMNLTNLVAIGSLFLIVFIKNKINIKRLIIYLIPIILCLIHPMIFGYFDDLDFNKKVFRLFVIILAIFIVSYFLKTLYHYSVKLFLKHLSIFIFFSSVVTILSFFFHEIQQTINLIIQPNMNNNVLDYVNNFRFNGLTGIAGAELSLVYSVFFLYVGLNIGENFKTTFKLIIGSLVVLMALMFVGRTGIVSGYIFFIFSLLYKRKYIYILLSIVPIIVAVFLSYVVYNNLVDFGDITLVLQFALEPIYKFVFEQELSSSNQTLMNMWYLPNDTQTILFGIGSWREFIIPPSGMLKPDAGYMRLMYEHGIILELVILSSYILFSKLFLLKEEKFIYLSLLFILLLFHIKEPFIYRDSLFSILSFIYFLAVLKKVKIWKKLH